MSITNLPTDDPSNTPVVQQYPFWEWTARLHVAMQEVGSSLAIFLFLGEAPQDPQQWPEAPNLAGKHSRYGRSGRRINEGFVPLNDAIMRLSGLKSFDPEVVEPYLKEKLQWKVQRADNSLETELQSLEIVVLATLVSLPSGEMFPVSGERREYNSITYGKPGGSRNSEPSFRPVDQ